MEKLIRDGKPLLDGTKPLYEVEKLICQKLGIAENFEEWLEMPLEVYWKLLQTDFVYAYGHTHITKWSLILLHHDSKTFSAYNGFTREEFRFKDYGKEWGFTKDFRNEQSKNQ